MTDNLTPEMSRPIKVCDIPSKGIRMTVTPDDAEKKALMERLSLVSLDGLIARIEIRDVGSQGILITGDLVSDLEQTCVATGEPVAEHIEEPFRLRLVGEDELNLADEEEYYLDPEADDLDLLTGDSFDAGEVVAQTLSIMMNPYPRLEGGKVEVGNVQGVSVDEAELERPNPFAILGTIKDKT